MTEAEPGLGAFLRDLYNRELTVRWIIAAGKLYTPPPAPPDWEDYEYELEEG
jgi:hypothetical protein